MQDMQRRYYKGNSCLYENRCKIRVKKSKYRDENVDKIRERKSPYYIISYQEMKLQQTH